MTIKVVHLWHPLKQVSRSQQQKIGQDAVTSSYKICILIKNEIIYLMQKTGLFTSVPFKNI